MGIDREKLENTGEGSEQNLEQNLEQNPERAGLCFWKTSAEELIKGISEEALNRFKLKIEMTTYNRITYITCLGCDGHNTTCEAYISG